MSNKNTFTVKVNNQELVLKIMAINPEVKLEAQEKYAEAFTKALDSGLMIKAQAEQILESRGLLDLAAQEKQADDLRKKIKDLELQLRKGVVSNRRMTKEEGRGIALTIRKYRTELSTIGSTLLDFMNQTVEAVADNERLQYLIYACTVHPSTGERFWSSYEAFKNEDNAKIIEEASKHFYISLMKQDKDIISGFYEVQWLIKMKFMNKEMKLIRDDGRIIDESGRLIDDEGRYINDSGEYIDAFGNKVDKDGILIENDTWGVLESKSDTASEAV